MKKILFCLAATALLATGCSGKGNEYKVSKKNFEEEITNYGFVLNNNARFEGSTSTTYGEDSVRQTIVMEFDSQGEHQRFKVHQVAEGEGEMESVVDIKTLESGNLDLDWYRKGFGDTSYSLIKFENVSKEELGANLTEMVYLPPLKYEEVKFKADNNSYCVDTYSYQVQEGSEIYAVNYSNLNVQFKDGHLNSFEFTLIGPGGGGSFHVEKTKTGGVAVTLPTIS